jgi:hypothetical protein
MIWLIGMMLAAGLVRAGAPGETGSTLLSQYWGTITSVRIDKCGARPGLCEGAIILAQRQGGEVTLSIRPGTWIKRGDRLVLLEELQIGHDVHVQAIPIAGGTSMRATNVEISTKP